MVIFIVAIGSLYALPNLYGEDHAVQISGLRNAEVNEALMDRINDHLKQNNIAIKSIKLENKKILVRVTDGDDQIPAKEAIASILDDNYVTALNLAPATPEWLNAVGGVPMKLGLDLRGGVYFLMEIDMEEAINKNLTQQEADFKSALREEKLRYRSIKFNGDAINLVFRDAAIAEQAYDFLRTRFRDFVFVQKDDLNISAKMSEAKLKETRAYAVQQNITILRNRVNQLGVAEPMIAQQGSDRIVVQLPGIQDTARAKEILGATATVEFRMQDTDRDVRDALNGRVPPGTKLYKMDVTGQPVLLKTHVILTGDHIINASPGADEYGRSEVNIKLDSKGGNKFSMETKKNVKKPMATVFIEYKPDGLKPDGKPKLKKVEKVISIATISEQLGSAFRISGNFSPKEAQNLALLLRAGALIAPIQIVEERTIGPSLGKENIELGTQAIVWGFCMVLVFMLFYYRGFGIVANLALGINLVLIVGVMSMLPGASLTLPGMAGIVLTVGMAVDANVLIFERIREELRDGRSPQQAIHHGYDSALSTIADANITTLIAAFILYAVGTGPIKGFAITLAIGIITSMFTAVIGTRAMVNSVWGGKRLEKLPI